MKGGGGGHEYRDSSGAMGHRGFELQKEGKDAAAMGKELKGNEAHVNVVWTGGLEGGILGKGGT